MIVAIDGTVSSGKSTIARLLAHKVGFTYVNTGAMYRAITIKVINQNMQDASAEEITKMAKQTKIKLKMSNDGKLVVLLDGEDVTNIINTPLISQNVAKYSQIVGVREVVKKLQKQIALKTDSVVEGRDIGTVVFPSAELKVFMTASVETRAQRRLNDYIKMGKDCSLKQVMEEIKARDKADMEREVSPLKPSEDAIIYYNEGSDINKVLEDLSLLIKVKKESLQA